VATLRDGGARIVCTGNLKVVITPQTISIAAGAALISYVSYRVLLLAIIAVIGTCAVYLLARPAPEPVSDPVPGGSAPLGQRPAPGFGGPDRGRGQPRREAIITTPPSSQKVQ
jgi:hypothetical protein